MYCPSCGTFNDDNNFRCVQCANVLQAGAPQGGYPPPQGGYPPQAGGYGPPGAYPPPQPGYGPPPGAYPPPQQYPPQPYSPGAVAFPGQKSRMLAGLLQLMFGVFGIGRFYLGYPGTAIAQILVTIVTCGAGALWPLIDGILILTGSVHTDGDGRPLGP